MFRAVYSLLGWQQAVTPVTAGQIKPVLGDAGTDGGQNETMFRTIKRIENKLAKKLLELDTLQQEFYKIETRISQRISKVAFSETSGSHENSVIARQKPSIVEIKNTESDIKLTNTEEAIKKIIQKSTDEMKDNLAVVKQEVTSHEQNLAKCNAALQLSYAFYTMIHQIHHVITEDRKKNKFSQDGFVLGIETFFKVVLATVLQIVPLNDLIRRDPEDDDIDEKVFLDIHKEIPEMDMKIHKLSDLLALTRDQLHKKYSGSKLALGLDKDELKASTLWQSKKPRTDEANEKAMAGEKQQRRHSFRF